MVISPEFAVQSDRPRIRNRTTRDNQTPKKVRAVTTTDWIEDITESNSAESPTNTEGRPVKDLNISEQIIQSPQIKESSYEEKPISPQVDEPDFSLSPTVVRTRSGRKVKSTKDNEKFVYF